MAIFDVNELTRIYSPKALPWEKANKPFRLFIELNKLIDHTIP